MGSVYNRGTRSSPNWYASYKDIDGKRRAIATRQPTKVLARRFLEQIEARIANGQVGLTARLEQPLCAALMTDWAASLTNRDSQRNRNLIRRHLVPAFGHGRLGDIDLPAVMRWLDRERAKGELAEPTIRQHLGLLSRFFAWAIERGFATANPVRQIPTGKRPKKSRKKDIPWLQDDALAMQIIDLLPEPANYMFYLGNRSGLRLGELVSLRMSDLGFLDDGVIRVRFSHDGPLKEDKDETGKTKWVPAADDCAAFLGPWLDRRRIEVAADPEAYVFPAIKNKERPFAWRTLANRWAAVREDLGIKLTWYQATRHSFASRLLSNGVSLDEVADALGHASPLVTRRYYDHFIRKSYTSGARAGFGPASHSRPTPRDSMTELLVFGVLGDIHAEDSRLACALAYLKASSVDKILSVGNIMGGPGDVTRTCALLKAADVEAVSGNHERRLQFGTNDGDLCPADREFLQSLPVVREYSTVAGRVLLCHGLGVHDMAGVKPGDEGPDIECNHALQALIADERYLFVVNGHTYARMVRKFDQLTIINAGTLSQDHPSGFARIDFGLREVVFFDIFERAGEPVVEEAERLPL